MMETFLKRIYSWTDFTRKAPGAEEIYLELFNAAEEAVKMLTALCKQM